MNFNTWFRKQENISDMKEKQARSMIDSLVAAIASKLPTVILRSLTPPDRIKDN